MSRFPAAVAVNVIVPGPGLVLLGRPWLGLGLVAWYAAGAELGLFGLLIAPATIPYGLSLAGLCVAAVAWLMAQILLISRIRTLRSSELPRELAILRRLAQRCLSRKDFSGARAAISAALSLDDADVESRELRTRTAVEQRAAEVRTATKSQ